ncbi:NAD-dependent epimerase/dehydratase family protein [Paludibacterium purpuratum]|uniref:Nucleoside-diphosphate-sugar epimerase n=1 Tax=Paludibacterium purpuratum TaxID=1144873 RepID=A0A4R7B1A8_9NEIS|nr:NAD-dependent epimerase/dehydratase family protein [Paludibacterium purpuratum]TDR76712.1 nucleoside-diphosphate-sugar epimerase [Paludibacterium purpuratum]
MKVLVTGANGMLGQGLISHLRDTATIDLLAGIRSPDRQTGLPTDVEPVVLGDLRETGPLPHKALSVNAIVHCAARVHVMSESASDPLSAYQEANVHGTLRLATQAAGYGVQTFIMISSIKVNGEATPRGLPFRADMPAAPSDPYGVSKWETEQRLQELSAKTGMKLVILRPPLIYGPGVGANFLRLITAIEKGMPLPLRNVHNRRSLISLKNMADATLRCLTHPAAAGRTFLVSDGEDLSTAELIRRLSEMMGRPARLLPFPLPLLRVMGRLTGKSAVVSRLIDDLAVDSAPIRQELQWAPPQTVEQGLQHVVQWHRTHQQTKSH